MHDGRVRALTVAHDDSCLVSAADDGTLLLLSNPLQPAGSVSGPQADELPSVAEEAIASGGLVEVPDLSPSAPTLEEAKQAAQANHQAAAAAAAHQSLVAAVERLRQQMDTVIADNARRPAGERVPQHMLELIQVNEHVGNVIFINSCLSTLELAVISCPQLCQTMSNSCLTLFLASSGCP